MKTQKPRLVSVTDRYGDELWIASASTVREELEENRSRPDDAPMATRTPTFADAPLLTRLDVLAAAALVGFGAGLIVGFAL